MKRIKKTINKTQTGLAILSGLLLTGSFPNVGLHWLAWFSLVPLLISLENVSSGKGFRLGFIAGLSHYLTLVYWAAYTIHVYGHLPWTLSFPIMFLLSSCLALYPAVFAIIVSKVLTKPFTCMVVVPTLWVSLEYIRSYLFTGFPWALLGYSQFQNLHLIQISDVCGVYGVSFLITFINGAIYFGYMGLIHKKLKASKSFSISVLGISAVLVALIWGYGHYRLQEMDQLIKKSTTKKISMIQGNIDQSVKWDPDFQLSTLDKYIKLSLSTKPQSPDLIVWPETAAPFYFSYNQPLTRVVESGIKKTGADFLFGSPSFSVKNEIVEYYNSAYLVQSNGSVLGKYNKVHLVPYGEYVPFKKWLPFLGKMVEHVGDFNAGKKGETLSWGKNRLGILICYEIIFPNLSRSVTNKKATLLINLTNDAWYGRTGAPYQHFSMAVFRAVENRRSLVRSANTGISGFIDPAGRVMSASNLYEDAVLTNVVPLLRFKTIYTRYGDFFCWFCMVVTISFLFMAYRKSKA